MKMKKFIAATVPQAMVKVKQELGESAVIFQTRKVTNRHFFNLLKQEHVEVLAAIDTDEPFLAHRPSPDEEKRAASRPDKSMALHLLRSDAGVKRLFHGPEKIEQLRQMLFEQGMLESIVDGLVQELIKKWYKSDERMSEADLRRALHTQLTVALDASRFIRPDSARFLMLVGPTGVGKTTTLAKLASQAVLDRGMRVALITVDTYRIAAIDQLKKYAEILNVPMAVAYSTTELQQLLEQYADYDRVLIDTAGRNFLDSHYVDAVVDMLSVNARIDTALVLSATGKFDDMQRIVEQFQRITIHHFIFSKMDETATYGGLLNLLLTNKQPDVLYITDGQGVPDDLHRPNLREFLAKVLGDVYEPR
ncbi:MAG: AAA family ATPase [Sporolactobacillus sp.]